MEFGHLTRQDTVTPTFPTLLCSIPELQLPSPTATSSGTLTPLTEVDMFDPTLVGDSHLREEAHCVLR